MGGFVENLVEGFARAANATGTVNALEAKKQRRQNLSDQQLEDTVQAHMDVMKGLQAKLGQNPDNPQLQQQLSQERDQLFQLLHPANNPDALGRVKQLFRHVFRQQEPAQKQPVNNLPSVASMTAAAPGVAADKWKPSGKPYQDPTTKQWLQPQVDATGAMRSTPMPEGWVPPTPPTKPPKGMKYDAATDQVVNEDTGQRYSRGAKDAPPEVQAMFSGAAAMTKKKEDFQIRMAATRGTAYNASRPISVFDSAQGNAPTEVPFSEFAKEPGRYIPASSGAKALAAENLMQDIMGTSQLTRQAIVGLKQDFPLPMKVKIALAMKADDPHSAIDQLIASGALGSLTDDQQNFLVATRQLAENAMAMRNILGAGQGSEDVRDAVRATLPSLLSPDRAYATKQLDAFDKTIARLHRGVPRVKLGDSGDASAGTTYKQTATGPGGHKIGSNDGGNTWFDVKTGKPVR